MVKFAVEKVNLSNLGVIRKGRADGRIKINRKI